MIETSIALLFLWEPVERSMKPLQNNQSQKGGDRVKADEDIIEYLDSAGSDSLDFQVYELLDFLFDCK